MALSKTAIQADIKAAFVAVMNDEESRTDSIDTLAGKLAEAVVNAIQSATIIYQSGLVSPMGAVTGTFQGELK